MTITTRPTIGPVSGAWTLFVATCEPVTEPLAIPPRDRTRPAATKSGRSAARRLGAGVWQGVGLVGSAGLAGARAASRRVREGLRTRRDLSAPGARTNPPADTAVLPVVAEVAPRRPALAGVAVLACVLGIVGLQSPMVEIGGGVVELGLLDVPYLGTTLMETFCLFTVLPVIDLVRRRLRWTAWLVLPAVLGAVPVAVLWFGAPWVTRALHLVWRAAPEHVLETGAAIPELVAADLALIVVAAAAIVAGFRARARCA